MGLRPYTANDINRRRRAFYSLSFLLNVSIPILPSNWSCEFTGIGYFHSSFDFYGLLNFLIFIIQLLRDYLVGYTVWNISLAKRNKSDILTFRYLGSLNSCDSFVQKFRSRGFLAEAVCPSAGSPETMTVCLRRPAHPTVHSTLNGKVYPNGGTSHTSTPASTCPATNPAAQTAASSAVRGVISIHSLTYGVVRVDSEDSLTSLTLQDCGQVLPGGKFLECHSVCSLMLIHFSFSPWLEGFDGLTSLFFSRYRIFPFRI